MSTTANERWRVAIQAHLTMMEAALAEVDAACPRTRYSWWWRAWWKVTGWPADVKAQQYAESQERARLYLNAIRRHGVHAA